CVRLNTATTDYYGLDSW
nr:immunoglobulin heavy chain junction region [Macaca mulatta]MOX00899.1 immunoglobulin heavy chain junction region [Macaca mulatta]